MKVRGAAATLILSPAALAAAFTGVAVASSQPEVASAARAAPVVTQLVAFKDGTAVTKRVTARAVDVRVEGRRCAAGAATPLAALVRSRVGSLRFRDYGSCTTRPRDSAGLFVRAVRGERNRGRDGWVYKVGNRGASAGAADPTGPFGSGRLRSGARLTWFYCRMGTTSCQRTLGVAATAEPGGLVVRVTGYDDRGDGIPVEGASVHAAGATAVTGLDGTARIPSPPGRARVWAERDGMVRSFTESVTVR